MEQNNIYIIHFLRWEKHYKFHIHIIMRVSVLQLDRETKTHLIECLSLVGQLISHILSLWQMTDSLVAVTTLCQNMCHKQLLSMLVPYGVLKSNKNHAAIMICKTFIYLCYRLFIFHSLLMCKLRMAQGLHIRLPFNKKRRCIMVHA